MFTREEKKTKIRNEYIDLFKPKGGGVMALLSLGIWMTKYFTRGKIRAKTGISIGN